MRSRRGPDQEFIDFVDDVEPRLRRALVATYGALDGRAATADALSWAWEHWERIRAIDSPVAYLYRVGQTSMRRQDQRPIPIDHAVAEVIDVSFDPDLVNALANLPEQQRVAVLFIKAFGWSQADLADVLDVSPSTIHTHLSRALARLRTQLEIDQRVH